MFTVSKRPTIDEIHSLYKSGVQVSQVIKFFTNRSKTIDKDIQAVIRYPEIITNDQVRWAEQIVTVFQEEWEDQWAEKLLQEYPLFGIPYNLKDNILVAGVETTSASKIMRGHISAYDATVYTRLLENGAILVSQSNLDEWAVGSSTENSALQITKNPFDLERVPGGSSGGPAAVVASGQVVFSLGSDTGGSIRVPAAFTDTVGMKTTYGVVPRYGVMPLSSSLDQVGVFANSVADNLLVTKLLAGHDERDQTTIPSHELIKQLGSLHTRFAQTRSGKTTRTGKPLTIGIPKEYFVEGIDPAIEEAVKEMIKELTNYGHEFKEVHLPLTNYGLAVYYTTMTVETASNLQRYDGLQYGKSNKKSAGDYVSVRNEHLGDEPKRRIMLGTFASSAGYYDAYYNKAMKVRELMRRDFIKAFKEVDVLLAPVTPEFPFKLGQKTSDPITMYLSDVLVYGANLARLPAISVPLGLFEKEGSMLPTGVQVIGKEFGEEVVYALAKDIETLKKNAN
jgi:aspartyl-tRNA(Asn)/glutamyl-tRNA(Gln) amidotransferase subunit A